MLLSGRFLGVGGGMSLLKTMPLGCLLPRRHSMCERGVGMLLLKATPAHGREKGMLLSTLEDTFLSGCERAMGYDSPSP